MLLTSPTPPRFVLSLTSQQKSHSSLVRHPRPFLPPQINSAERSALSDKTGPQSLHCLPSFNRRSLNLHALCTLDLSFRSFGLLAPYILNKLDMFTPPPSPLPPSFKSLDGALPSPPPSRSPSPPTTSGRQILATPPLSPPPPSRNPRVRKLEKDMITTQDQKRRTAGRIRLAVILVPLVLVLVTLSTRYVSHPLIMDFLAGPPPEPQPNWGDFSDWSGHPAHVLQRRQNGAGTSPTTTSSSSSGIVFPSLGSSSTSSSPPTGTQTSGQTVPTVPSSAPPLPTPFPQAFDTTLGSNFTTDSCEQFFANMTQSPPFRQCRPFSFLSQTSSAFLQVSETIPGLAANSILTHHSYLRAGAEKPNRA